MSHADAPPFRSADPNTDRRTTFPAAIGIRLDRERLLVDGARMTCPGDPPREEPPETAR